MGFIIAGAGQIYNGQTGKGILIFLTGWLFIPWLYGIFDAYSTAKRINSGEMAAPQGKPGCAVALFVGIAVVAFIVALMGLLAAVVIPNLMKAKQAAMGERGMPDPSVMIMEMERRMEEAAADTEGAAPAIEEDGGYAETLAETETGVPDAWEEPALTESAPVEESAPEPAAEPEYRFYRIYLKNGQTFEAEVEREFENAYVFKLGGGTFEVDKIDIEEMKPIR
jgi:hypothetical protein